MKRVSVLLFTVAATVACNQHPVSYVDSLSDVEFRQPTSVDPNLKLDLLWVIDNSGSMCQEQAALRQNFDRVVDELDETGIDFHLGVTTTHMEEDFPTEPVARPGHLQSTPQPVVGFDSACYEATDSTGATIEGDFTPVRQLIDIAVDCMETPDESYRAASDDDIRCALGLFGRGVDCEIRGRCALDEPCDRSDLFPPAAAYRELPKVLESEAYRAPDGTLDVDRLKADFACMSTVGVRGYGFEKGLGAAVRAVSPELTGGAVGAPDAQTSAPNHGLIRPDARFALVFVTDENDCTHDGGLAESAGSCGGDVCEYWNHPDVEDVSPLVAPEALRDELLENLRRTKGVEKLGDQDVLVASIHGTSERYAGDVRAGAECLATENSTIPPACGAFDLCESETYEQLKPTCETALGKATSGDRYERFLRAFGEGNYFPSPSEASPEEPLFGWMCTGDFRPALTSIAQFFRTVPTGCITRQIRTCDGPGAACPDHPYSGEPGTCTARPNSDEWFCDSYVQIRVYADDGATVSELAESGFCHPESLGEPGFDNSCVIARDQYGLAACSGEVSGVKVDWANIEQARQVLAGTTLELRYSGPVSDLRP